MWIFPLEANDSFAPRVSPLPKLLVSVSQPPLTPCQVDERIEAVASLPGAASTLYRDGSKLE
jgi:hypothetical protein